MKYQALPVPQHWCKLKQWTGEEPVWRLTQPWKSHCRRQDELFSSWSIDLDVNGWFFSTWEYWLNQLCSTFGVPRTFSSTGLVLLRAVVLQCSVNALRSAAEWRMKDKQKERGPRTSPASFVFIVKKSWRKHIWSFLTKRNERQSSCTSLPLQHWQRQCWLSWFSAVEGV